MTDSKHETAVDAVARDIGQRCAIAACFHPTRIPKRMTEEQINRYVRIASAALTEAGAIIPPEGKGPLVRWDTEAVHLAIYERIKESHGYADAADLEATGWLPVIARALGVPEE